ncbi:MULTISPECIES: type IV pilus biogenesis protein PilP [Yersinia]|uniref:type IV pilus biogenesis protein PilP n=1 Tax=Yersinia TaxID=629 RepID=UPI000B69F77B|nr:type IV pilus biogenesis protein PilP [Yersinia kristensenii]MBW5814212.1 type IV pilus biogenesis protein PilP [Yersinia kristensenii]MBW5818249.1 type IV pilus biogenesis protein PilP [Yersinia kristensenii]MBW5831400.1 type IV pilus biogenesis protein PilP [Yersinia kristensenii]MBW5844138.1 type IV pilus biogenesis protein PilP [Yersinia kristensenii]MDA5490214.1 type IV pilus biogenesis protein PilP [Yersinia kristensenii]
MHKNNPGWLWLPLVIWAGSIHAADFQTSAKTTDISSVTVGQLESIQQKNMLLEAQVHTARLQRQLRESEQDTLPVDGNVTSPGQENIPKAGSAAASPEGAILQLEEIYGRGNPLRARIRLATGGVVEVTQGDILPGSSLKVMAITDSVVKLSDGSVMSF